jgi:pantetheine-phosphate adenylyltransferase
MPIHSRPSRRDADQAGPAVFTGAFDPITLGHMDVIRRAYAVFQRLVVGVGANPDKVSLFTLDERVELVRRCVADLARVTVASFDGLAVRFVREQQARVIVRGVRSMADMDYELTMARTNRMLEPEIETVLLPAGESVAHISSTLIRQIAREAGRRELAKLVPAPVIDPLLAKFRKVAR